MIIWLHPDFHSITKERLALIEKKHSNMYRALYRFSFLTVISVKVKPIQFEFSLKLIVSLLLIYQLIAFYDEISINI
jgi:hypothetical protein